MEDKKEQAILFVKKRMAFIHNELSMACDVLNKFDLIDDYNALEKIKWDVHCFRVNNGYELD